ncbi:helix-turn-helix domain-containing protein [Treponema primitia]|uniref:helix-turn-helix domain-containing protein n=1 Tax=Treponema primitia TaxID=88058 RepID=UPI00397F18C0
MTKPLTIPEAAKQIGLSSITIRRMIYAGKIGYRKIGARYFFMESDLAELMESAKHPIRQAEVISEVKLPDEII